MFDGKLIWFDGMPINKPPQWCTSANNKNNTPWSYRYWSYIPSQTNIDPEYDQFLDERSLPTLYLAGSMLVVVVFFWMVLSILIQRSPLYLHILYMGMGQNPGT